ncbi:MAG: hypothetical protein ACQEP7_07300 [bacterium]
MNKNSRAEIVEKWWDRAEESFAAAQREFKAQAFQQDLLRYVLCSYCGTA